MIFFFLLLWALATLVQLLFWSVGVGRLWRQLSLVTTRPVVEVWPPVSVVVCARNEAANLQKKLDTLLQQDYPNWELLVVDDASTDDTPNILARYQHQYPRLQVLRLTQKTQHGKKGALTAGIQAAQYDRLLLTDADCAPASPYWMRWMVGRAEETSATVVLGTGPYTAQGTALSRWVQFETAYVAVQYLTFAVWGQPYMGVGRNLSYTKTAFEAAGGLSTHADVASGDDDLLVNAIATSDNTALCWDSESAVYSDPPRTWKALYHQKTRHYSSSTRYQRHHQFLLGMLSASQVLFYLGIWYFVAAAMPFMAVVAGGLYGLRAGLLYRGYGVVLRPWQQRGDLFPYLLLLDALLPLYYALFALSVLRPQNNPRWKSNPPPP